MYLPGIDEEPADLGEQSEHMFLVTTQLIHHMTERMELAAGIIDQHRDRMLDYPDQWDLDWVVERAPRRRNRPANHGRRRGRQASSRRPQDVETMTAAAGGPRPALDVRSWESGGSRCVGVLLRGGGGLRGGRQKSLTSLCGEHLADHLVHYGP